MMPELHRPVHPVRFVTAASLFDGHDAAINIMRRLLQAQGRRGDPPRPQPVCRRGGDRGHPGGRPGGGRQLLPGRPRRVLQLPGRPAPGGRAGRTSASTAGVAGTIVAAEIEYLHRYGVARIFSPQDGQAMGLAAMVNTMIAECDRPLPPPGAARRRGGARRRPPGPGPGDHGARDRRPRRRGPPSSSPEAAGRHPAPSLGITGTGGSGKSSLTDELVRRFRLDQEDKLRIAVLAIDPTRRRAAEPCSATASG